MPTYCAVFIHWYSSLLKGRATARRMGVQTCPGSRYSSAYYPFMQTGMVPGIWSACIPLLVPSKATTLSTNCNNATCYRYLKCWKCIRQLIQYLTSAVVRFHCVNHIWQWMPRACWLGSTGSFKLSSVASEPPHPTVSLSNSLTI